jgi:hypothetical protein
MYPLPTQYVERFAKALLTIFKYFYNLNYRINFHETTITFNRKIHVYSRYLIPKYLSSFQRVFNSEMIEGVGTININFLFRKSRGGRVAIKYLYDQGHEYMHTGLHLYMYVPIVYKPGSEDIGRNCT